ncbi:retention module-containing protein [Cellvibrio mixtus]|uniref:retention module-containing protein n=1 Tax=Cellvibrio mixtus TaxID=39650 RepID=UPI000BA2579A|nr:retention module-containing protein [Cellvibrio mixtus]
MSNAVATVAYLQGQAWAKAPDGSLRPLTLGAVLHDNEILVTAEGARVELDIGGVEALVINGGQEVAMSRDMNPQTATSADEALLNDASVEQVLAALEQDGDLLDELEETAAGDNGASGGGSNSFVRLDRISESTDSLAFTYAQDAQPESTLVLNDGEPVSSSSEEEPEVPVDPEPPVNSDPVSADQTLTVDEDTALNGQIIATDANGDTLSYAVTTNPANGTLTLDPTTGAFVYTPNANYNGSDSFVVTISDGKGGTTTSTVNIGVTPVNDAPVSADQNLTTDEDVALPGQIVASDVDGDTLSYVVTTNPANGTLALDPATGAFVYTPNANYNGNDSFVVTISDGKGGTTTSTVNIGVTPVNDAPVSADQNLTTDEDVALPGQIVASDVDGDTLSYVVTTNPANGTLTLDPATGAFVYTPNANYNGNDSFVVTISDGKGGTTTSTVNIGVTPVNDAPVSADQNLTTDEDVALPGQIVATDVDGDTLTYTVTTNPANGTLTLDPATGAFVYTPNANYNGSDSFVVTISDGKGGTTTSTVNIGVTPVNDAPVSADQNLTTDEDVALPGQIVASDVDGDTLSYVVTTNPANGTLALDPATGAFVYTPNANYNGNDSFVVTISDGKGGTTTSTVNIGVTPVNDAPVSADQNLTTDEDVALPGQIVASDVDGDTLSYAVTTNPANGTLTLDSATGAFVYTPNANYNGNDSFVVTISDGKGGTTTSTINIGVTPVNNAPTSADQNLTTDEDVALPGQIVASDVDGDTLSYAVKTNPANGTLTLDPATGAFVYTPNANYNGSDSFVVTISDGKGGTTTSTVNIGVTPVNDAPVSADQNLTTDEDVALPGQIVASDVDGDTLSYAVTTNPANGTLTLDPVTGAFVYTPNANYNGNDSFVVTISDGKGGTTTSTVNIGVTPVNDAPVSADQNLTTDEDVALPGQIVASDVDGDTLSYSVTTNPANGTLTLNPATGAFVYTPNANYNGSDSFVVTISDGKGGTTTSTVNIGVTPVNDAPVSADQNLTTDEDVALPGQIVATDVDGDTLSYAVTTNPANGTLTLDSATGAFVYTPNANYNGSDSFVVTISDGKGGTTTSTVNIGVTPVNDAPVSADQNLTTEEDTPIDGAIVATDADGDTLAYSVTTGPVHGTVTLNPATGTFTYTPNTNYNGSDSFVVTISDGKGGTTTSTINIGVTPVNNAPTSADQNLTTDEDVALPGQIVASDVDGDTLSYAVTTNPANGTLTVDPATGAFVYTPNANYNGSDSFVVTISDGKGGTTTSTVNIGITPVNDAPVAADDYFTIDEDTPLVISPSQLLANDTDVDGNPLTIITIQSAVNGTLNVVGGNIVFTPAADYSGPASFRYTISDGKGGFSTGTVHITVNPVNDPTVMKPEVVSVLEDSFIEGNVLANDYDPDDVLSIQYYEIDGVKHSPGTELDISGVGTFLLLSNGDYTFTPFANYNGPVPVISYTTNTGASSTLTITITPVNDLPVAVDDNFSMEGNTSLVINPSELLANDYDIDGDILSVSTIFGIDNGTVSISGGNIIFTPTPGFSGAASFSYTVSDGKGGYDTAKVNINVTPANIAPVANDDNPVGVGAEAGLHSEYFAYRQGTDGPNLTNLNQVVNYIDGKAPSATFTATTLNYNPGNLFDNNLGAGAGANLRTFLGSDATSLSNNPITSSDAIIRMNGFVELEAGTYKFRILGDDGYQIKIDGVTVAEVSKNQSATLTEHPSFTIATGGLHTIEIVYWDQGYYARFTAELSNNGGATYQPFSAYNSYKSANFVATEDTPYSISAATLLANDTDANGDTLSIQSVQGATHGTVALVGGNVVFTPAVNYAGPASFTYTVTDGRGGVSTATVNLVVKPVNDAPVAVNDNVTIGADKTTTIPTTTLLANDVDVDGDILEIISVQNASHGTVSLGSNGVIFTPTTGYEGNTAGFEYTVRDPSGLTSTARVNLTVGSANAPSVVVSKTLVAVAHGTGGTSVKFPITTKLVDTDGSESLSIKVSNVPTGLSFNAGVNLGGGVWQFTEADLPNLMLNIPGSYSTTNGVNLTVQVTSTEMYGGFTASTSSIVMLKASYTTVDITTTASGNYTGSSASEYIQGGAGDNIINGANGNNIINGGAGNDTITTGSGSDIIYGGSGNDIISSGSGNDRIYGGAGNDIMKGGEAGENFVDVFVWNLGDQGVAGTPAVDTIQNFSTAAAGNNGIGGDVLDLRDLLQGESVGASNSAGNLADYLHFEVSGGNTVIHISHTGGFGADSHAVGSSFTSGATTQQIVLEGVNLQSAYNGATTDQQIITQLLNNNKLITD